MESMPCDDTEGRQPSGDGDRNQGDAATSQGALGPPGAEKVRMGPGLKL